MKIYRGKVISIKLKETATVLVSRLTAHPIYKKRLKRTKKYQVHDEIGVKDGDLVEFIDSRPISKTKSWKIIKVINKQK